MNQLQHDIFISHAHCDKVWVEPFRDELGAVLNQEFPRVDTQIWIDSEQLGGARFSEQLEDALKSSAILISVISEGYLQSEWCRREREVFIEACGGIENCDNRIFALLLKDARDLKGFPDDLAKFSYYRFFEKDGEITIPIFPPIQQNREGNRTLHALKHYLVKGMRALQSPCAILDEERRRKAEAEAQAGKRGAAKVPSAEVAGRVFLAEVPSFAGFNQFSEARRRLEIALTDHNIAVSDLAYTPGHMPTEKEARTALDGADLFLQILTPFSWASEEGYAQWIFDQATKPAQKPAKNRPPLEIVRWQNPGFDFSSVTDEDYLQFLARGKIDARPEPEFIKFVLGEVRKQLQRGQITGHDYDAKCLFVCPDSSDGELGQSVGRKIVELIRKNSPRVRVESRILKERHDVSQEAQVLNPRGLILVLHGVVKEWIEDKLREFRETLYSNEVDPPECAVFVMDQALEQAVPPWPGWIREVCYWKEDQVGSFAEQLGKRFEA